MQLLWGAGNDSNTAGGGANFTMHHRKLLQTTSPSPYPSPSPSASPSLSPSPSPSTSTSPSLSSPPLSSPSPSPSLPSSPPSSPSQSPSLFSPPPSSPSASPSLSSPPPPSPGMSPSPALSATTASPPADWLYVADYAVEEVTEPLSLLDVPPLPPNYTTTPGLGPDIGNPIEALLANVSAVTVFAGMWCNHGKHSFSWHHCHPHWHC